MNREKQIASTDLSKCADEPIHIPGSIQPHGVLIAVVESEMRIVKASENVGELLGISHTKLLGKPITELIGELQEKELVYALKSCDDLASLNPRRIKVMSKPMERDFDAIIHRVDNLLIIELEAAESELPVNALEFFRTGFQSISESLECGNTYELLNVMAKFTRALTGFGRTMVYLFDADWHGSVLAESRCESMDSYLGSHFPASDIPAQARALYKKNRLRLLVDVDAKPSPIYSDDSAELHESLDMSNSTLRSMSPIHIEYLKNMEVASSMSISILGMDGELRGLIACHNSTPMYVNYQTRAACDFLAQLASLKLAELETQENSRRRLDLGERRKKLISSLTGDIDVSDRLFNSGSLLLDAFDASGAAILIQDRCLTIGATPDDSEISRIILFLNAKSEDIVFSTDCLLNVLPEAEKYKSIASGLLATRTSEDDGEWLLWFRPEQITEINWAGSPDPPVNNVLSGELHPRKSFANWKQLISGKSVRWSNSEIDSLIELRTSILEKSLTVVERKRKEQLQERNDELALLNIQLETLANQLRLATKQAIDASQRKSEMVSVVSHDLLSPLTSIHGALSLLAYGELDTQQSKQLYATANDSSSYLISLVKDLLNLDKIESGQFAINRSDASLDSLFKRACALVRSSADTAGVELQPNPTDIVMNIDADRILQVIVNLVSNAIKFSPIGGVIEISAHGLEKQVLIQVKDQGRGVPEEFRESIFLRFAQIEEADSTEKGGTGLGLAICKALTEAHGGTIGVESTGHGGSTFWLKLPIV